MNKIQRVSVMFRIFFQVFFIALPILGVIGWMYAPESWTFLQGIIKVDVIPRNYNHGAILHTLSAMEKVSGFIVTLLPMAIQLYVLYCLIKLFRLYEQNEVFSLNTVRYIRNVGYALLIDQLLNPVYEFLMGIVLTIHNPPGHRFAAITVDQTNFGVLLIALIVILISWIMLEGCKLREEQQLTI